MVILLEAKLAECGEDDADVVVELGDGGVEGAMRCLAFSGSLNSGVGPLARIHSRMCSAHSREVHFAPGTASFMSSARNMPAKRSAGMKGSTAA